jgi:hypothetical protein
MQCTLGCSAAVADVLEEREMPQQLLERSRSVDRGKHGLGRDPSSSVEFCARYTATYPHLWPAAEKRISKASEALTAYCAGVLADSLRTAAT